MNSAVAAILLSLFVAEAAEARRQTPYAPATARTGADHRHERPKVAQGRQGGSHRVQRPDVAQLHLSCPAWPRRTEFDADISGAAVRAGLDPCWVKAQAIAESSLRPSVCSTAGACGLMQLLPGTAKDLKVADRLDPRQNLRGGTRYMAWQKRQWARHGRTKDQIRENALSAYNVGLGRVLDCQRRLGGLYFEDWTGCLPKETVDYVGRISDLARGRK